MIEKLVNYRFLDFELHFKLINIQNVIKFMKILKYFLKIFIFSFQKLRLRYLHYGCFGCAGWHYFFRNDITWFTLYYFIGYKISLSNPIASFVEGTKLPILLTNYKWSGSEVGGEAKSIYAHYRALIPIRICTLGKCLI